MKYIFLILFLLAVQVNAENILFEENLPSKQIYCFQQDKDGFMWVGTSNGLLAFYGNNFKVYNKSKGLSDNIIRTVFRDSYDSVWIGTYNGLMKYNKSKDSFVVCTELTKLTNTKLQLVIHTIIEDNDKNLWITTSQGIYKYIRNKNSCIRVLQNSLYKTKNAYSNVLGPISNGYNNSILFADKSLYMYSNVKHSLTEISEVRKYLNTDKDYYIRIHFDGNYTIWMLSHLGSVIRVNLKTLQITNYRFLDAQKQDIINASALHKNTLYFHVKDKGIYYYSQEKKSFILYNLDYKDQLPSIVHGLNFDSNNILWLSAHGILMHIPNNKGIQHIKAGEDAKNWLPSQSINAISVDSKNNLYIGTDNKGLAIQDFKTKQIFKFDFLPQNKNGISSKTILTFFEDSKQRMWIGTYLGGLCVYNSISKTFTQYKNNPLLSNSIAGNDIRSISEDAKGNLWIALHGQGYSVFNPQTQIFTNYKQLKNNFIGLWTYSIQVDSKQRVWVATSDGIFMSKDYGNTFKRIFYKSKNQNFSKCFIVTELSNKTIAIGTEIGLFFYNEKTGSIDKIDLQKNESEQIIGIVEDAHAAIWMTSNNEVIQYIPSKQKILRYTSKYGLINTSFSNNAICINKQGKLLIGGADGVDIINTQNIVNNAKPLQIQFLGLKIWGQDVFVGDNLQVLDSSLHVISELHLMSNQNQLEFEFAVPDLSSYKRIMYEYKIDGIRDKWVSIGNSLLIANLKPGNYILYIKAYDYNTPELFTIKQLEIIVHPEWWQTLWFKLFLVIVVLGSIITFYKVRENRIQKQKRLLDTIVQERTLDLVVANEELQNKVQTMSTKQSNIDSIILDDNKDVKRNTFLHAFNECIDKNLENEHFSIEDAASEMAMSRVQLFRKCKLYTDLSAIEYLNSYKLHKAKKLLSSGLYRVSEVSYMVGYSNPKYFSTCFTKEHGKSPSMFIP